MQSDTTHSDPVQLHFTRKADNTLLSQVPLKRSEAIPAAGDLADIPSAANEGEVYSVEVDSRYFRYDLEGNLTVVQLYCTIRT